VGLIKAPYSRVFIKRGFAPLGHPVRSVSFTKRKEILERHKWGNKPLLIKYSPPPLRGRGMGSMP